MDSLHSINFMSICIRILFSLIIGEFLGIERGRKNRPAGFRTYMLVCLGSTLIMMTNQYVYQIYNVSDPTRMGAQVISGIGFLGAGTIMVTGRNQIKGITTAAGMWTAAACGLAIGIGFYMGAILGAISIFIVMSSMHSLDLVIRKHSSVIEVYLEFDVKRPFSEFMRYAREQHLYVVDIQLNKNKLTKDIGQSAILSIKGQHKCSHDELIELINNAPGIQYFEEL